jgi:hypothetical protein
MFSNKKMCSKKCGFFTLCSVSVMSLSLIFYYMYFVLCQNNEFLFFVPTNCENLNIYPYCFSANTINFCGAKMDVKYNISKNYYYFSQINFLPSFELNTSEKAYEWYNKLYPIDSTFQCFYDEYLIDRVKVNITENENLICQYKTKLLITYFSIFTCFYIFFITVICFDSFYKKKNSSPEQNSLLRYENEPLKI